MSTIALKDVTDEIPFDVLTGVLDSLPQRGFPIPPVRPEHLVLLEQLGALLVVFGPRLQIRPDFSRHRRLDIALFDIGDIREKLIKLLLADRIEFVVVALRAANGQSEPNGADRTCRD